MEISPVRPVSPRTKLMELIDILSEKRIIYIHAPAGYGKTFSVKLWLQRTQAACAWVTLGDKPMNISGSFCEAFALALHKIQPDNDNLTRFVKHPSFNSAPYEFTIRAIAALNDDSESILVIDDLHMIRDNEILKTLQTFIGILPESFIVFVLSRFAPPDSFSESIMKDSVAMIDSEELKFSFEEMRDFFRESGLTLSRAESNDAYASTGGWPIGINALLLSSVKTLDEKLAERHFETFLKEKVWVFWEENLREFMLKTSVVQEFTAQCATWLTGSTESKKLLTDLLWENAFISIDTAGTYRFHDLFRDFLFHMLEEKGIATVNKQLNRAGDWFLGKKDYYRAAEYYKRTGYEKGVSKCIALMYDYNSTYASIADTLTVVKASLSDSLIKKYPFLLEVQAWVTFMEGRAAEYEEIVDRYYKMSAKIIMQNPKSAITYVLFRCVDYRDSFIRYLKTLRRIPFKGAFRVPTPTISYNMPHFHRSSRDFSELALDLEKSMPLIEKTIGAVIGEEFVIIKTCFFSGIYYEKDNLNEAYKYAVLANSSIQDHFSPELKFCAKMILASVYAALHETADCGKTLDSTMEMIEQDNAYYLSANLEAFTARLKLADGDREAAHAWLNKTPCTADEKITFYKLYCHMTTARALICIADYNTAILHIQKIAVLCQAFRRPIDIMETDILLAVAYWKKGRGYQQDALEHLEKAIFAAQEYGYIRLFANEGAELTNMLQKILGRTHAGSYDGPLHSAFVKTLYLAALSGSKHSKGLTGGRMPANLKFTDQQMIVMRHLCDGHSYKEIADIMELKYTGVKSHMQLICKKLDVPDSVGAIMKIKELELLD